MNVVDIVTDSLRRIGIISESQSASAEQGADALTRLNDLMAEWAGVGIDFGWNPKATTAETQDISAEHVGAVKANLCTRLAASYGVPVDPSIIDESMTGYSRLQRQALLGLIKPVRTGLVGSANLRPWSIVSG